MNKFIKEITYLLLSVSVITADSEMSSSTSPPLLKVISYDTRNYNVTIEYGRKMFISTLGGESSIKMECSAPYPIQWSVPGHFVCADETCTSIHDPVRISQRSSKHDYLIKLEFVYLRKTLDSSCLSVSTDIICQNIDDFALQSIVSVFVIGNQPTLQRVAATVEDSLVIPCFTTNPTLKTELFLEGVNGNEYPVMHNVFYNPTEGFLSRTYLRGKYICKNRLHSVAIEALSSVNDEIREANFHPTQRKLRMTEGENITLRCSSKTNPVQIFIESVPGVNTSEIRNSPLEQEVTMKVTNETYNFRFPKVAEAKCFVISGNTQVLAKEWEIEISAAISLLSGKRGSITVAPYAACHSYSPIGVLFMQIVTCGTTLFECKFKEQFLNSRDYCKLRLTSFVESHIARDVNHHGSTVSAEISNSRGFVRCRPREGPWRYWDFVVTLNSNLLLLDRDGDWSSVHGNGELVQLENVQELLYSNETTKFTCHALDYLFGEYVHFELETENGTTSALNQEGIFINVELSNATAYSVKKEHLGKNFGYSYVLTIDLPVEATGVSCIARLVGTDQFFLDYRRFKTKYLLLPEIENNEVEQEQWHSTEDKYFRLICNGNGEPWPIYQWEYGTVDNGSQVIFRDALQVYPELRNETTPDGEGYLEFPNAEIKYSGLYKCKAKNRVGSAEKKFSLKVKPPSKTALITVTVAVLILLIIGVGTVILCFVKHSRRLQKRLRVLTENELQEFLSGMPELLGDDNGVACSSMEMCEMLPYNINYEIPLEDIQIDQSAARLLGSGQFSYVMKAKMLSQEREVAVKIPKSKIDVNLFTVMLKEVKVMIYAGKHEHVVEFVGVCTKNIRERRVHIITEFCELGSLESFLFKSRSTFRNSLSKESEHEICILDLVRYSLHVASGMEYLSEKNIVHADLAARNVLLTANRIAKISDFGLSRQLYSSVWYEKKTRCPLPFRWMSPESISSMLFSVQSDVWSFGVLLYEIFTLSDKPFPEENNSKDLSLKLQNGMRLGRPKYTTPEIYCIMQSCWEINPESRQSFAELRAFFDKLVTDFQEESFSGLECEYIQSHPRMSINSTESQYLNLLENDRQ